MKIEYTEENRQKVINHIIDKFDFDKVHRIMTIMDWQWNIDNDYYIPSADEIKSRAIELLNNTYSDILMDNDLWYDDGSGGLEVLYDPTEDFLELKFVIEERSFSGYEW